MTVPNQSEPLATPAFRPKSAKLQRMLQHALIQRLDAQDRSWYLRIVLNESAPPMTLTFWKMLTHVGGVTASIIIAFIPLGFAEDAYKIAAVQAAWTLGLSHLVVQVIKRNVVRVRPAERVNLIAHVALPDKFSFPSGHSAAVMSVAFIHAFTFHTLAWPMLGIATIVGFSRVRVGAHYPGDVLIGQLIAIATGVLVLKLW
jgi:undecaprenyl-diphosphatase